MKSYESFLEQIETEVVGFRRDHDVSHFKRIASLLATQPIPANPSAPGERDRVTFSGWVSRRRLRLTHARLRKANPGYVVKVSRMSRRDLSWKGRYGRYAFRVTATGAHGIEPFHLLVHGPGGQVGELPSSNAHVDFQRKRLNPNAPIEKVTGGYLDQITVGTATSEARPREWLARLMQEYPNLLLEFSDTKWANPFRETFIRLLQVHGANDWWGDRYRLVGYGLDGEFRSDLEAVKVDRPNRAAGNPGRGLRVPILRADGDEVRVNGVGAMMPVPDDAWLTISNAQLQNGGTITSEGVLICYEASADPRREFVAGTWDTIFGSYLHPEGALLARARPKGPPIPEGILIGGRCDFNWFHWMVEYLPRVLKIPDGIGPNVPLLLSNRVPATGIDALRELTDRPIRILDRTRSTAVGTLHVVAPPVQVLDTTRVPWADGISVDRSALDELRVRWRVDRPRTQPGRRVFAARRGSGHRGITNEAQLARIAEGRGWEVVDTTSLTFAQQRDLMSQTELFAGASGAIMANYLMMLGGSRILALTSRPLADFVLPAVLADIVQAEFSYLTGPPMKALEEMSDRNSWFHADFQIDPDALDHALASMEGRASTA